MKNSKRLSGLIKGSKIAAAGLLASAVLACSFDAQTVNPAKIAEGGVLEQIIAGKVVGEDAQMVLEDKPSYVRKELHETYGVPPPQDMMATTLELKDLEYITFIHDEDLGSKEMEKLMFGITAMHDYAKQRGMPEVDVDVKIYNYSFPPELFPPEVTKNGTPTGLMARRCYYDRSTDIEILLNKDIVGLGDVAHELFHAYQQILAQEREYCFDKPEWLNEGSAEFFMARATAEAGEARIKMVKEDAGVIDTKDQIYDRFRASRYDYVKDYSATLFDTGRQEHEDQHTSGVVVIGSPNTTISLIIGLHENPYTYGFFAAEYLASIAGETSILDFYGSLQYNKPWEESFQEAFGLNVAQFYNRFEKHYANGFPKLDIPKGKPYVHEQEQSLKE